MPWCVRVTSSRSLIRFEALVISSPSSLNAASAEVESRRAGAAAGSVESGFVQADVAFNAYAGKGRFAKTGPVPQLRAIANLYPESIHLVARADSEILIDNHSPMNIRVKDLVIDSSGGFAKYNGVYLTQSNGSDIATYNRDTQHLETCSTKGIRTGR